MTRRRWIADEISGDRAILVGRNAEHLARVLRARVGQQFDIATPGGVRAGTIAELDSARVVFTLSEVRPGGETPSATIHLYLAVFKFDRMEWAIEKVTELGVARITPVLAQRTDTHLAAGAAKRAERWRRITHEAAQQSRRAAAPEIMEPVKLAVAASTATGTRIVLDENERDRQLASAVTGDGPISFAVGPEGGWTDAELSLLHKNNWMSASLGSTILRAETAAIAAVAVCQAFLHDAPPAAEASPEGR
jgi:16S rRNA (uracil1498-N3)-methyltransferase